MRGFSQCVAVSWLAAALRVCGTVSAFCSTKFPARASTGVMQDDIAKILLSESRILARLDELGEQITRDFRGKPMTVVAILNGSCLFLGDLLRRIPLPLTVECISVASYHGGTSSSGKVELMQKSLPAVAGRNVLLVDDILDTGRTLSMVRALLAEFAGADEVRTCVLLRKRVERAVAIEADYAAFEIPNEFVVGYGLDYLGHYRNLPFIGVLKPEVIERMKGGLEPAGSR